LIDFKLNATGTKGRVIAHTHPHTLGSSKSKKRREEWGREGYVVESNAVA